MGEPVSTMPTRSPVSPSPRDTHQVVLVRGACFGTYCF